MGSIRDTHSAITDQSTFHFDFYSFNTYTLESSDNGPVTPVFGNQSDLCSWLARLQQKTRAEESSGRRHISLAVVDYCNAPFRNRLPSQSVRELLEAIGIPENAFIDEDVVSSHKFPPDLEEPDGELLNLEICRSVGRDISGTAWKYYPKTKSTIGIIWSMTKEGQDEATYILKRLEELQHLLFHPSLLSLLSLQAMTVSMRHWIDSQKQGVIEAQLKSGHHQYAVDPNAANMWDEIDYADLSLQVSGVAANIVTSVFLMQGLLDLGKIILEDNTAFVEDAEKVPENEQFLQGALYIQSQTKYWIEQCDFMKRKAASWERKASIVVAGLFNLIAQRDQRTSISIAKTSQLLASESKKDSTSMKAIAAVTMFFLPGTFVSSFFAMPLFQWDDDRQAIEIRSFWLYWAITVPLTVATFIAWVMWTWLSGANVRVARKLKA